MPRDDDASYVAPAAAAIGKIMKVERCAAIGKCQSHPAGYRSQMASNSFSAPTDKRVAEHALAQLEAARKHDVETHEANIPALHNNIAVAQRVEAMMKEIGMPSNYSERDAKSRSRWPKTVTREAGWRTDLRRECWTDDGFAAATQDYERMKRSYLEFAAEAKNKDDAAQREREREAQAALEKRRTDMQLAAILLRYGIPIESTWGDVLECLCSKDQRVDLAVAMMQTRADWSEGCYRVVGAMRRFTIRTDEDKDIAADVMGCTSDFEDGRVFRDAAWNYDRILGSVEDKQLVADVQVALANTAAE